MDRAKFRISRLKFYRYGILAFLTALWCILAFPLVDRKATPVNAVESSILRPSHHSVQLAPTSKTQKVAIDTKTQHLLNIASNAQNLEQQAKTLYEDGRFSEAVEILLQVLQAYQASGDTLGEAVVHSNLALNYQQLGRVKDATQEITTALELAGKASNSSEQLAILAQSLDVKASLQLEQGKANEAAESWEQAAVIYNQLGDTNRAILSRINQAQALQALGLYRRAIAKLEQLKDTLAKQPDSLIKATNLRSLGEALRVVGNLEEAEVNLKESLKIAQALQSPDAISAAYLSLGNLTSAQANATIAQEQKKPAQQKVIQQKQEEALNFYQQAFEAANTSHTQIQAQLNRLRLLIEMEKWQEAQALYPQVQSQLTSLPLGRSSIYAQVNFARSLMRLYSRDKQHFSRAETSKVKEIAQILTVVFQQANQLGDVRSQVIILGDLAYLYEQQQQWSEAEKLTNQALIVSQNSSDNTSDISYRLSWQLGRIFRAQGQYEKAIAAYKEAFNISRSVRADLAAINSDIQFSFRQNVEPVYREFIDLLLKPAPGASEPTQENLKQAGPALEALQIAQLQNFLQEPCEAKKLQLDQVIDQKTPTAAIIYTIILNDRLEVILKLPKDEKLYHHSVQLSRSQIEQTLTQLRQELQKTNFSDKPVQKVAKTVYDWLIASFRSRLDASGIKTLVFILDGPLRTVPMSALYDGERYLVETYATSIVLGLQVTDPKPLRRQNLKVLAAGLTDPPKEFEHIYKKLANVNQELNQIQNANVPVNFIRDQAFTQENFQQTLNSDHFQVIHLATHGQFGASRESTYLLAADGAIYVDRLDELFRMRGQSQQQAIELLVLSACKTASGNDRAVLGIAGTVVRAGARSAIAGLWSLSDASSSEFAQALYKSLGEPNINRAEALRQAQLALLKTKGSKFKHPRFWAAYVLVGSWL